MRNRYFSLQCNTLVYQVRTEIFDSYSRLIHIGISREKTVIAIKDFFSADHRPPKGSSLLRVRNCHFGAKIMSSLRNITEDALTNLNFHSLFWPEERILIEIGIRAGKLIHTEILLRHRVV